MQNVSTHSRPKAAGFAHDGFKCAVEVSTHSRPKAAGRCQRLAAKNARSFNTQPPEGGWTTFLLYYGLTVWFQHTAARRRLGFLLYRII